MNWHRHFLRGIGGSHVALNIGLRGESEANCSNIGSGNDRISGPKIAAAGKQYYGSIELPRDLTCRYHDGIALIAGGNRCNIVEAEVSLGIGIGLFNNSEVPRALLQ